MPGTDIAARYRGFSVQQVDAAGMDGGPVKKELAMEVDGEEDKSEAWGCFCVTVKFAREVPDPLSRDAFALQLCDADIARAAPRRWRRASSALTTSSPQVCSPHCPDIKHTRNHCDSINDAANPIFTFRFRRLFHLG